MKVGKITVQAPVLSNGWKLCISHTLTFRFTDLETALCR